MTPICATCGTDFACYDSRPQPAADGWFTCPRRCAVCSDSLLDGSAVMEHPGLGARIHLACCPDPEEPDPWPVLSGLDVAPTARV
ncbi:MAG: hypothetical protein IPG68_02910 [Micrococcales bacterium]|nr:hypothetical protein [Micrococcales bacterium]